MSKNRVICCGVEYDLTSETVNYNLTYNRLVGWELWEEGRSGETVRIGGEKDGAQFTLVVNGFVICDNRPQVALDMSSISRPPLVPKFNVWFPGEEIPEGLAINYFFSGTFAQHVIPTERKPVVENFIRSILLSPTAAGLKTTYEFASAPFYPDHQSQNQRDALIDQNINPITRINNMPVVWGKRISNGDDIQEMTCAFEVLREIAIRMRKLPWTHMNLDRLDHVLNDIFMDMEQSRRFCPIMFSYPRNEDHVAVYYRKPFALLDTPRLVLHNKINSMYPKFKSTLTAEFQVIHDALFPGMLETYDD